MSKDKNKALLELILPDGKLEHFDLIDLNEGSSGKYVYDKILMIHLEEKNKIPQEYKLNITKTTSITTTPYGTFFSF